tara:strand:+ start:5162 stop:6079 length:918 start_codon:yes stop_codon:yes gene_type:complete
MSFEDYMQNRKSAFEKLTTNLKTELQGNQDNRTDDRIWKPKMGKDGTGYAVIRLLPGTNPDKTPWVRMYDHGFQGPTGKWYIENSLTTIGQKDPVSEYNTSLWNSGIESNKDVARKQKRRTSYFANALILKDPDNSEHEGQVKMFRFGQKIFDKIMSVMQPEFADDTPVNPFDLIEGANFRIKIKIVSGYWNYDSSEFEKPSMLSDDDAKMKSVFEAQHDVHELVDATNFKTYEELSTRLNEVTEKTSPSNAGVTSPVAAESSEDKSQWNDVFKKEETGAAAPIVSKSTDDDEDLESYFKSLAND